MQLPQDEKTVAPCQAVEQGKKSSSISRHFWILLFLFFALSALFYCLFSPKTEFLAYPQIVGFLFFFILRGVHTATVTDFVLIAIPINAAIYTLVIFLLLRRFGRSNSK